MYARVSTTKGPPNYTGSTPRTFWIELDIKKLRYGMYLSYILSILGRFLLPLVPTHLLYITDSMYTIILYKLLVIPRPGFHS